MFHVVLGGGGSGGETTVITVPAEKAVFKKAGDPAYQASADDMIYADTSAGAVEVYAPGAPVRGMKFGVVDTRNTFDEHQVVVRRNGSLIQGAPADFSLVKRGGIYMFRFDAPATGWRVDAGGYPLSADPGVMQAVCASAVQAYRVVCFNAAGRIEHAYATNLAHADCAFFLTLAAGGAGGTVEILSAGQVTNGAWALDSVKPMWLGLDGLLTQVDPLSQGFAFLVELGDVLSTTQVMFQPRAPIVL